MDGEEKTICYNLLVQAENEEKALDKINETYGLNNEEWNFE